MSSGAAGVRKIARVADAIRDDIRSNRLEPGQQLGSDRELADKYDVAVGTVRQAISSLQDEGWVVITPSVGKFVTEQQPEEPVTVERLGQDLAEMRATVAELEQRLAGVESAIGTTPPPAE